MGASRAHFHAVKVNRRCYRFGLRCVPHKLRRLFSVRRNRVRFRVKVPAIFFVVISTVRASSGCTLAVFQ